MDAPPTVDQLLAHAGWVKALARRIVADGHDAEEIAQETLLRALERPPRSGESGARLRGWLARVASRFALQRWRSDDAARRREQASATLPRPAGEPPRDVALVVAHAELHRRVVEAVLALAEPYRATLLLRFFEDEAPPRIAERTGVPLATVHTRLRRGVEQLRERFAAERGDGGELRAWLAAGEAVGAGVAARALIAAATVALLAWGGWRLARTIDATPDDGITPIASAPEAQADFHDKNATPDPAAVADRRLEPATPSLASDVAAIQELVFGGAVALRGRVVDEEGNPIAGARCELRLSGDGPQLSANDVVADELLAHGFARDAAPPPRRTATSDARGDFQITGIRHGLPYRLLVAADGFAPALRHVPTYGHGVGFGADAGATLQIPAIVLSRGAPRAVRVVDSVGSPVAGAEIHVERFARGDLRAWLSGTRCEAVTDRDGLATLVVDGSDQLLVAARASDGRVALARGASAAADPIELRLRDGADFGVAVHLADGTPLPGVEVQLEVALDEGVGHLGQKQFTDASGAATFPLLPRGAKSIHLVAPGGTLQLFAERPSRALDAAADSAELTVALAVPPIAVRFVDPVDGAPVVANRLLVVDAELGERESSWPPGWSGVATRGLGVLSVDGRSGTLLLAPPHDRPLRPEAPWVDRRMQNARFRVVVDATGFAETWLGPFDPATLRSGEPLTLPIERGARATLLACDAEQRLLPAARAHVVGTGPVIVVSSYSHHAASVVRSARADATGRIELGPLARGAHRVTLEAPGFLRQEIELTIGDGGASSDSEPRVVTLDRGAHLAATVALDPDELPDRFAVVLRLAGSPVFLAAGLDDDGMARFEALAPGRCDALAFEVDPARRVDVQAGGLVERASADFLRVDLGAGDATIALVPRRLDRGTVRLDVAVIDAARPGVTSATLRCITDSGERIVRPLPLGGGRVVADVPVAARYLLTLAEARPLPGGGAAQAWVVAEEDFTSDELRRGLPPIEVARGRVRVALVDADGAPWRRTATLRASRAVGSSFSSDFTEFLVGETRRFPTTGEAVREIDELPAGPLWFSAECGDAKGETEVDVRRDGLIEATITLRAGSD